MEAAAPGTAFFLRCKQRLPAVPGFSSVFCLGCCGYEWGNSITLNLPGALSEVLDGGGRRRAGNLWSSPAACQLLSAPPSHPPVLTAFLEVSPQEHLDQQTVITHILCVCWENLPHIKQPLKALKKITKGR